MLQFRINELRLFLKKKKHQGWRLEGVTQINDQQVLVFVQGDRRQYIPFMIIGGEDNEQGEDKSS